jgi:hypothetical protein
MFSPGILTKRRDQAILARVHYPIAEGRVPMEEQTGTDLSLKLVVAAKILLNY